MERIVAFTVTTQIKTKNWAQTQKDDKTHECPNTESHNCFIN